MTDFYWEAGTEYDTYDEEPGAVTSTVSLDQYIQDASGIVNIIQAFGLTTEDLSRALTSASAAIEAQAQGQSRYSKALVIKNEKADVEIELIERDWAYSNKAEKEWWPPETFSPSGALASWQAALAMLAMLAALAILARII